MSWGDPLLPAKNIQLVSSKGVVAIHRAPSCPEMKFLKFHSCPVIVLKSAIVLKFYSFGQNVLIWTFVMLSLHFFTSHDYVCVTDVECQVMFSLVTLYCFVCNIALVTFLGLQN